jgi:hypothetical protein
MTLKDYIRLVKERQQISEDIRTYTNILIGLSAINNGEYQDYFKTVTIPSKLGDITQQLIDELLERKLIIEYRLESGHVSYLRGEKIL